VYLDASAAVKLLMREPETDDLRAAVTSIPIRVSSELLGVELHCVAQRQGGGSLLARAERILAGLDLLPYTASVRSRARAAFMPPQRALDAIHLASALEAGLADLVLMTYDQRQAAGARAAGLAVMP